MLLKVDVDNKGFNGRHSMLAGRQVFWICERCMTIQKISPSKNFYPRICMY
uniref:Uncharacterized protein n=1 Tax=Parascaris univalens TaxID=6257 RepID=A0A914ZVX0_PARUN